MFDHDAGAERSQTSASRAGSGAVGRGAGGARHGAAMRGSLQRMSYAQGAAALAPRAMQFKLMVGGPSDAYEQEADAVADRVVADEDASPVQRAGSTRRIHRGPGIAALAREGAGQREGELRETPADREGQKLAKALEGVPPELAKSLLAQVTAEAGPGRARGEQGESGAGVVRRSGGDRAEDAPAGFEASLAGLGGGAPLDEATRGDMEPRLGADLGNVRVHTGPRAAEAAGQVQAKAFALGSDIVFGAGQYQPGTTSGRHLLAHELVHTQQQAGVAQRAIQRNLFDFLANAAGWVGNAVQQAASALWDGTKAVGHALGEVVTTVGQGIAGSAMWVLNLVRELPARTGRLALTIFEGVMRAAAFVPSLINAVATGGLEGLGDFLWDSALAGAGWVGSLAVRLAEILGAPEILQTVAHLMTRTRRLTSAEVSNSERVMGAGAIRYGDVRVASGGILDMAFKLNGGRAFVGFHTIAAPPSMAMRTMQHELIHVRQHEKTGAMYAAEALQAQIVHGTPGAYIFGDAAKLQADHASGRRFSSYGREQQASMAEAYWMAVIDGGGKGLAPQTRAALEYFMDQLRAGEL